MAINNILAGVAVGDFEQALEWYQELFGRFPDSQPMRGLAEWRSPNGGWLQLFSDPARAGAGSFTLAVSDLDGHVKALRSRGVAIGRTTKSELAKTAAITDPDGNQIVLAEALTDTIAS